MGGRQRLCHHQSAQGATTDKYSVSEIDYISDEAGKKYVIAQAVQPAENSAYESSNSVDVANTASAEPQENAGPSSYYDGELLAPPKSRASQSNQVTTPENKEVRVLTYQIKILFGVAVFAIGLVIFFKMIGMKGSAYGKHSLFPARVVRLSGQYGIVDQGKNDGVKLGDIIRLYRKKSRRIQFKAKVKVIKVENSYSAVELLKGSRRGRPEVGDVGYRDRNFVAGGFKRFRILSSFILGLLAKMLEFAARNLKIENKPPVVEINMFNGEPTIEKVRPDAKTKSRSSAKGKTVATEE